MNEELLTPGVPTLSETWIAQRTQHLMEEVASPSPRRKRRFVLTGASAAAVAVAASVVGMLGPWSTPAFTALYSSTMNISWPAKTSLPPATPWPGNTVLTCSFSAVRTTFGQLPMFASCVLL